MAGKDVSCPICIRLLNERHFDMNKMNEALMPGSDFHLEMEKMTQRLHGKPEPKTEPGREQVEVNEELRKDAEGPEANQELAALAMLKSYGDIFELLECGAHSKAVPVRCTICVNRNWPAGKVLEIQKLRPYMVKNFLDQHLKSSSHQRHAREAAAPVIQVETRQCEGLRVECEQHGGKLFEYRHEFNLWAQYSNFHECASHQYQREPNNGSWIVRSGRCLGECDFRPGADRQMCAACADLGKVHGVSGFCLWK